MTKPARPGREAILAKALDELEAGDPQVKAARQRLEGALASMQRSAELQPEIDAAKREAVLNLLSEKYAAMDQSGLDAMIVVLAFRGYVLTEDDLDVQLRKQPPEVIAWWEGPCDCGGLPDETRR